MGAGCSSPAPSPPGVAPFAPDSVAPAEPSSTPPTRVEADASSPGNSVATAASSTDDAPQDRNTIRLLRAVEGNAIAQMKKILEDGVDLGRRLPGKEVQDTFLLRALELQHEEAKTGAGYDSVSADDLSADAKRAKTGGA